MGKVLRLLSGAALAALLLVPACLNPQPTPPADKANQSGPNTVSGGASSGAANATTGGIGIQTGDESATSAGTDGAGGTGMDAFGGTSGVPSEGLGGAAGEGGAGAGGATDN